LLVEYAQELPRRRSGEKEEAWEERLQRGLDRFKKKVQARYTEGTLQRLLQSRHTPTRRAAVLALGLMGTMESNGALAGMLHDEDLAVRRYAADALWQLWFRADEPANNEELQRLIQMAYDKEAGGPAKALAGLNALIRKAPRFAEAYNQRALLYFRAGRYDKAAADCAKALKLNPHHFGAASGMAQCFMKQKKLRAALRVFRRANRINPNLDSVREAIQSLERMLGEEGKR